MRSYTRRGAVRGLPWRHHLACDEQGERLVLSEEVLASDGATDTVEVLRASIDLDRADARWLRGALRRLFVEGGEESLCRTIVPRQTRLRVEDDREASGFLTVTDETTSSARSDAKILKITGAIDLTSTEARWLIDSLNMALSPSRAAS
jgi:hypothetical protein